MTSILDPEWTPDELVSEEELQPERERFHCPEEGCEFYSLSMTGLRRHQTRTHGPQSPATPREAIDTPDLLEEPETAHEGSGSALPETPPRPRKTGRGRLFQRVRSRLSSDTGSAPKPPKPKRPVTRGRRISTAPDISSAWFFVGRQMESSRYYPVGRMLQYQQLAAGPIIDEALAGTALDRWALQPIWRSKDRYEKVFYLVGPVVAIAMLQSMNLRQQEALAAGDTEAVHRIQAQMNSYGQMVGTMMRPALVHMAPSIAESKKRIAQEDAAIREAFPDLPPGVDPIQALFSELFAPPGTAPGPPPAEEETADVDDRYSYAEPPAG